ncbi:MAG: hypothetical protein ACI8UO_002123 [Verrucomicrobiales bacterium]|jgi:hypothetical protein
MSIRHLSIATALAVSSAEAEHLSDWLDLPPVMERLVGDPGIKVQTGDNLRIRLSTPASFQHQRRDAHHSEMIRFIRITTPTGKQTSEAKKKLVESLLNEFWNEQIRDSRLELIALDRERFVRIGLQQLLGAPDSADRAGGAWWRVRMGLPLNWDSNDALALINARHTDEAQSRHGHFAVGLRPTGGDAQGDLVFDPRPPWLHHEPPTVKDWLFPGPDIILGIQVNNLYDWIHTQTNHRDVGVTLRFFPLAQEQALLLRSLAARDDISNFGRFETRRNNCATLGQELIEGLLPLNEKISRAHPFGDYPDRLTRKMMARFKLIGTAEIDVKISESANEATSNSTVHRAPNRSATPGFRELRLDSWINGSN